MLKRAYKQLFSCLLKRGQSFWLIPITYRNKTKNWYRRMRFWSHNFSFHNRVPLCPIPRMLWHWISEAPMKLWPLDRSCVRETPKAHDSKRYYICKKWMTKYFWTEMAKHFLCSSITSGITVWFILNLTLIMIIECFKQNWSTGALTKENQNKLLRPLLLGIKPLHLLEARAKRQLQ